VSIRLKTWIIFLVILLLAGGAGFLVQPREFQLGSKKIKLNLGLDLEGGTHLVYEADLSNISESDKGDALEGVRDILERKVNSLGVSEPVIQMDQHDRIIIELAGIHDLGEAIKKIGETPFLEFKEENPDSTLPENPDEEALKKFLEERYKPTGLSGKQLDRAEVVFDPTTNEPQVSLQFDSEGKKLFAEITQKNLGKSVAIFLDDKLISSPRVQSEITDGNAVITGGFSIDEAKEMAKRLNSGALPVPIKLVTQQTIGASLGEKSFHAGIWAGLIGFIAIAVFMILYYRVPGLLAVIALAIYVALNITIYKTIPVTLTLAGIAGFILSIGMAVDANVLIFERLKEELKRGRNLPDAVEEGFKRAWTSIRDSNFSTLITCLILIWFGTSVIKGFAYTLSIGVILSMFTAIIITKNFLRLIVSHRLNKHTFFFGMSQSKIEKNASNHSK
jgi:protein-export membrane protein SecD